MKQKHLYTHIYNHILLHLTYIHKKIHNKKFHFELTQFNKDDKQGMEKNEK